MPSRRDMLVRRVWRAGPTPDSAGDAALLGRYVTDRDGAAFAALVARHGPLVLHVCRRVLGNADDAEDAFQATFLVLARKAAGVRPREALAGWLHGVARRVALKARTARARRARATAARPGLAEEASPDPFEDLSARELLALVDDEVQRLPAAYRLPVILCCLEGHTQDEVARQLGWSAGSVKGRLERGRARLHARLVRRGLTLSAALAAAEVSRGIGSAALAGRWAGDTVRVGLAFATDPPARGGVSTPAVTLAREAMRGTALANLKLPAALVLAACLLTAGFAARRPPEPPVAPTPAVRPSHDRPNPEGNWIPPAPAREPAAGPWPEAANHPVRVSGRVLDPAGRPFAGAKLYVGYAARRCDPTLPAPTVDCAVRGTTGAGGRFEFTFARSDLDERYLDVSRPIVVATADGFGLAWAELGDPAALDLRLVEDVPVEGRILDRAGDPVAGARVSVREVTTDLAGGLSAEVPAGDHSGVRSCRGPLPGHPPMLTTDADGWFRLTGLGRNRLVVLTLAGAGVGQTDLTLATTANPPGRGMFGPTFEFRAQPSRTIRGVVREKGTRRPVAGARVTSLDTVGPAAVTDADGRYELSAYRYPHYQLAAQPRRGEPLFAAAVRLPEGPGPDPLTADFDLTGGIPLRGRVTDQMTGQPPRRAVVTYYPIVPNPHAAALATNIRTAPSSAPVRPDGSYSLAVLPGPGVVFVSASPRDLYASAVLDDVGEWAGLVGDAADPGRESGIRVTVGSVWDRRVVERYNAVALINPEEGAESASLDLTVRPAHAVRGTVVGPDGAPVAGVRVCGLTAANDAETLDRPAFTVEGLNPRGTRELTLHHRQKGLGKIVTVRGGEADPITVRLDPCGEVTGRAVDRAGRPLSNVTVSFMSGHAGLAVSVRTGPEGRFRVSLVPGPRYDVRCYPGRPPGPVVVEVDPGGTKDLGDLILDR